MAQYNHITLAQAEKSAESKQRILTGETITVGKTPETEKKHGDLKVKNQYISLLEVIGRISKS
jgi:hypothetical protein